MKNKITAILVLICVCLSFFAFNLGRDFSRPVHLGVNTSSKKPNESRTIKAERKPFFEKSNNTDFDD